MVLQHHCQQQLLLSDKIEILPSENQNSFLSFLLGFQISSFYFKPEDILRNKEASLFCFNYFDLPKKINDIVLLLDIYILSKYTWHRRPKTNLVLSLN